MTSKQFRQLLIDKWWVVVLALMLIGFGVWLFTSNRAVEKLDDDINQQKGVNSVIEKQIVNAEQDVNNAKENTNQAQMDFDNSVRRDSNSFVGNANAKFCARFPDDSSCK